LRKNSKALYFNMKKQLLLCCLLAIFGCKDEPERIPSYIKIQPFTANAQGDASWHKITEGWLYVNGEYLGSYTLPATVPVLAEGKSEVLVFPGVKKNGILATPDIYPVLTRWESKNVVLTPGEDTEVKPATVYDVATNFPLGIGRGDFDGGSSLLFESRDSDPSTTYSLSTDGAFFGKCLLMEMDTAHPVIEIASEIAEGLPITGSPEVWLELHYNCDMTFYLYLLASSNGSDEQSQAIYQFNPTENWNKIYLNLTEAIIDSQAKNYRLFFRAGLPKDSSGKYTQMTGTIRLDNIRITHL
jgi:hypothetical protein